MVTSAITVLVAKYSRLQGSGLPSLYVSVPSASQYATQLTMRHRHCKQNLRLNPAYVLSVWMPQGVLSCSRSQYEPQDQPLLKGDKRDD